MPNTTLSSIDLERIVKDALAEDCAHDDVTTNLLIPLETHTHATFQAKQSLTVAGIPAIQKVFEIVDPTISMTIEHKDGHTILPGQVIATLKGSGRSILNGERVALNFLQHLSGIATMTHQFCKAIQEYPTKILDTRKTTPGLRKLQKWAVTIGGGLNHRMSLSDGILIKDNHLAILNAQGVNITLACRIAKSDGPHDLKVCVEIESLNDIEAALDGQADILLLDNMTPDMIQQAVSQIKGRAITEVSGGINLGNVCEYAAAGADFISIGALTHSAPAADISLNVSVTP